MPIPNTNCDADTDSATLARQQIKQAIDGLNETRVCNLRDYGATASGSDCLSALNAAIAAGAQVLQMPWIPGESGTAYFSAWDVAGAITGKTIDIDPRITLSVPDNQCVGVPASASVRHMQPTRYFMRSLANYYVVHPASGDLVARPGWVRSMPYIGDDDIDRSIAATVTASAMMPRKIAWNTSDTWTADSFSATSSSAFQITPSSADGSLHFGFVRARPGDEFICSMSFTGSGVPLIAACVRHSNGFSGVWSQADYAASTTTFFDKINGTTGTSSAVNFLGASTHGSYSGLGAHWTVRIDSWTSYTILLAGIAVARVTTTGLISEVGFGGYPTASGQTITANDIVRMRGVRYRGGEMVSVRVYGDSKTADRYDAWPTYFKDMLDMTGGVRCWRVINRAVAGQAVAQQRTVMAGDSVGDSNVVIIDIGTNDIQGATAIATFLADLAAMVAQAKAAGCRVVLGVPSLWYTQGQAGARGQASTLYDRGAQYRTRTLRLAAEQGVKVVDNTRYDGPVVANYVNPSLSPDLTAAGDPVVYDNIHPTTETNRRRAWAYACAVAGYYTAPRDPMYLPLRAAGVAANGWALTTQPPRVSVDSTGHVKWHGLVDSTGSAVRTNGTVIMTLPQALWPLDTMRFRSASSAYGEALILSLSTAGELSIYGATTATWVSLDEISYSIEDREAV